MGSTESVLQNLEALKMQMQCQCEFAQSGLEIALGAVEHWRQVAASYKSDYEAAMQARASVERFREAAAIFGELLAACERAGLDAELVLEARTGS